MMAVLAPNNRWEGSVMGGSIAAGAGRQCAPTALIGRSWAAPQLHR
jgi:hypothetical protein